MSEHVFDWIPAYHDGELTGAMHAQVEAHLAGCGECQAQLSELRALSSLLRDDPLPAASEPAGRFAGRLIQRLPGHTPTFWQRMLPLGLRYAPLALFAAWAFFQAVSWVSGALLLAISLSPAANQLFASLLPLAASIPASVGLQMNLLGPLLGVPQLDWLSSGMPWIDSFGWFLVVNIALLVGLAGLFFGWLAAWWAFVRRQNKENDHGPHSHITSRA